VHQTIHDGHGVKLPNPPVYMIFWGSAWNTQTNPSVSDCRAQAASLLAGPYLSRLSQYSNAGQAALGQAVLAPPFVVATTTGPGNTATFPFNDADIQRVIREAIDTGKLPDPFHTLNGNQAIYAVVTPPTATLDDPAVSGKELFAGYHETACFTGPCI